MNAAALERMRESCSLAAECLVMVGERIRAGITTDEINTWVHEYCLEHDALPAPLNYKGFPKSVCTSVNDCVCHGIPDGTVLKDGDIINVDVTTIFPNTHGYYGDTSVTFYIGEPSEEAKLVTEVARRGLELGIAQVRHGAMIGDIITHWDGEPIESSESLERRVLQTLPGQVVRIDVTRDGHSQTLSVVIGRAH